MEKRTFDVAGDPDWYAGIYEFQRPIFVVTDKAPEKHPKQTPEQTFTFIASGLRSVDVAVLDPGDEVRQYPPLLQKTR